MAVKKDSPKNYDRWDTIPGAIKITSKNTPEQQKLIDKINAERAAAKKAKKNSPKK